MNLLRLAMPLLLVPSLALAQGAAVPAAQEGYALRLIADGDWIAAVKPVEATQTPGAFLLAPMQPQIDGAGGLAVAGLIDIGTGQVYATAERGVAVPLGAPTASAAPLWCGGITALMSAAGMTDECIAPHATAHEPLPRIARTQLSLGYALGPGNIRVTYGDTRNPEGREWSLAPSEVGTSTQGGSIPFSLPLAGGRPASRDLTLASTFRLGDWGDLLLAAGYAQSQPNPGNAWRLGTLDQSAVRLGVRRGALSGAITGRVVRGDGDAAATHWSGLDLGISWRTPWSAEISFGAENLLGRGNTSLLPSPPSTNTDESAARTPYVRYRQDL